MIQKEAPERLEGTDYLDDKTASDTIDGLIDKGIITTVEEAIVAWRKSTGISKRMSLNVGYHMKLVIRKRFPK